MTALRKVRRGDLAWFLHKRSYDLQTKQIVHYQEASMKALNPTSLLKKVTVLLGVAAASSLISFPVLAQLNPNPSIFNEPPYNGSRCPRPDSRRSLRPAECGRRGRYRQAIYGGPPAPGPGKGKGRHRRSIYAPAPARGPVGGQPPAYNSPTGRQPNYTPPPAYSPAPSRQPNYSPPPVPLPVPRPN